MRNPAAKKTANRSTLIAIGLTLTFLLIAALGNWEGMIGLALGLMLYFLALAHLPLGIVALIAAFRSGDHLHNSWIYGYFGCFALAALVYLGSMVELDESVRAGWERITDSETVALREFSGGHLFNVDRARAAISAGANVNTGDEGGRTPLMLAANEGSLTLVSALLDAGAEVNARAQEGGTALHYAAGGGTYYDSGPRQFDVQPEVVAALLNAGAEADARNRDDFTPLMAACRAADRTSVQLLLDQGAGIDVRSKRKQSCLTLAVEQGHGEFVLWLMDNTNVDGLHALPLAASNKHVTLFKALLDRGASLRPISGGNQSYAYNLADDSRQGNEALLKLLIDSGRSREVFLDGGYEALGRAVTRDSAGTVRNLLALGADPEATGTRSETLLHFMARMQGGEPLRDKIRAFVEAGADADVRNAEGATPLFDAVGKGNLETAELLLSLGADPNARTNGDKDLAMVVASSGYGYMLAVLIEAGLNVPPHEGHAHYLVSARDHPESTSALLAFGLDPNMPDERGDVPLVAAIRYGPHEVVKSLIEGGADLTVIDSSGYTPLTLAAQYDKTSALMLMFERGADPSIADARKRRVLDLAIRRRNVPIIVALLERGESLAIHQASTIREKILSDQYTGKYVSEREALRPFVEGP